MERPSWAPAHIDVDRPSIARVYDYSLGGSHFFAADREFALQVLDARPDLTRHAQEIRAFLPRAVRHLREVDARRSVDLRRPDSTDDPAPRLGSYPGFPGRKD